MSPARPTAAVARDGQPPRQMALLPADLVDMLEDALKPKRDGTRHHWGCLNKTMNASVTPCSPRCVKANEMVTKGKSHE